VFIKYYERCVIYTHKANSKSQTHNTTTKYIESLSNKNRKHETKSDLVNIFIICRAEGTNSKNIVSS